MAASDHHVSAPAFGAMLHVHSNPTGGNMKKFVVLITASLLGACSGSGGINSRSWTCDSVSKHVIEMSQQEDSKILEITNISELQNIPDYRLSCSATAEWSKGEGGLEFGAHVSDGGKVIVEYNQK
jgi:hypothetical protein